GHRAREAEQVGHADRRGIRVRGRRRLRGRELGLRLLDLRPDGPELLALRLDHERVAAGEHGEQADERRDREAGLREPAAHHDASAMRRSASISNWTIEREPTSVSLLDTSWTWSSSGITERRARKRATLSCEYV